MRNRLRKYTFLIYAISLFSAFLLLASQDNKGIRVSFNQEWLFYLGKNEDARFPETSDAHWQSLNLPHFEAQEIASQALANLGIEESWYRKRFSVPIEHQNKTIGIHFDGAHGGITAWINGHYVGASDPEEKAFHTELTPHIRFGESENILSVRLAANAENPSEHGALCLNENVWLEIGNPSHAPKSKNPSSAISAANTTLNARDATPENKPQKTPQP